MPKKTTIEAKPQYADTDMMGVVYHANYLKYFELGRTAFIEAAGYSYVQMEEEGYFAPVYDAYAKYKQPLKYGDVATIVTWLTLNDGVKTIYTYEIRNQNDEVCVTGYTTHVIVKKDTFRPVPFKRAFPEWFKTYQALMDQD
ncbi:acyl-CoA thioester hydrolase [Alkalihalobacillus xiaoxiensis]|uniref:Acyl-CoA thioester hydrolase n=1 Tax=Shouchella xiaoxiensis TaxID=766895 RepID=A0ABS2SQF6_9BACI|nr:thioesterase family protein [Shouchella xiaoxiensis]MBM7837772.1 acyl-CoA thioester hydrolase [Shouchella xiaoxiensis]